MKRWIDRLRGAREPAQPGETGSRRWVVIDVETSGMDRIRDRLVSIGAVAVHDRRIVIADSLELTLGNSRPTTRENILLHGIGAEAQRRGLEPKQAMARFLDYVGNAPLLAFHAGFDRGFLLRAASVWLGVPIGNLWIDIAQLAKAMHPGVDAPGLDDWLEHFGISIEQRHNAGADALATAMLFLRLVDGLSSREREPRHLQRIAANARWLGR